MSFVEDGDGPAQGNKRDRDENLVRLFGHLFHEHFCAAENIPPQKKMHVLAAFFCGWCDRNMLLMDAEDVCAKADVPAETWEHARTLIEGGTAPESLYGVWYSIVLSDRPPPERTVTSINMVTNLTYSDGTISTTCSFISREMFDNDAGFSDHIVAGILRNSARQMLDKMMEEGVDGLWKEAQKNKFTSPEPEDPFEVLMGWIIKHLVGGEPVPPGHKLKPALRDPVMRYMRLAQQCIRPPIPKQVIDAFKARQRQAEAKEQGKPRGGWDA